MSLPFIILSVSIASWELYKTQELRSKFLILCLEKPPFFCKRCWCIVLPLLPLEFWWGCCCVWVKRRESLCFGACLLWLVWETCSAELLTLPVEPWSAGSPDLMATDGRKCFFLHFGVIILWLRISPIAFLHSNLEMWLGAPSCSTLRARH